ncbi:MAG TPA: 16S rRNA (cytosine(1402)-N(4))-methyltransferase, partial [Ruminococcaceae bacterium]|nr:16S rRNA (cytosine(1402)-N(4))-methyltransferase [Oscillospiraceae bacterium]
MEFRHRPVLFRETIESLNIRPNGVYIDGTAGSGGHSKAIAERLSTGALISIDRDPDAVAAAAERLKDFSCAMVRHGNFSEMDRIAAECGVTQADGVLLDIGVSSYQLDNPERG